ncbi:Uu.00g043240.m01.CDS01 [Anthostomella pinea]|uniref:Uu.00g043240.m01.CDS01 n=1 Tax=Anthostomella pinea TaxID=933095 RepID=A0AAI8VAR2_9PEZI|nr:Uu.00g043240.m01.CDS01 [Anthostomella pinea]
MLEDLLRDVHGVTPVQEFVDYEVHSEHATDHDHYSKYAGPPTDEQDDAWDDLIRPVYFNISREELEAAGESLDNIVELVDGGYPASISVYHELHCLRNLRLYLYQERYYPNHTEAQDRYLHGHLGQPLPRGPAIECHVSRQYCTELIRMDDKEADKPATKSNSRLLCVNWSAVEEWSYSRMISTVPPIRWQTDR